MVALSPADAIGPRRNTFAAFLDDAAVFPPGNAPVAHAVRDHAARMATPDGELVGPLVLTPDHLPPLRSALADLDAAGDLEHIPGPVPLSLVVRDLAVLDGAVAEVADETLLRLAAVEIAATGLDGVHAALQRAGDLPGAVDVWVEPGFGPHLPAAVALLQQAGLGLKLRTGGTVAQAFPSEQTLAEALAQAVAHGVRFKATAGLHHAVRHTDPVTGFEHHGFANLLLAAHAAESGTAAIAQWLACRDSTVVAAALRDLGPQTLAAVRRTRFVSFGTCDVDDPRRDLEELGILDHTKAPA